MLSDDPQRNSLVQRVWLYNDDPALKYRCSVRALLCLRVACLPVVMLYGARLNGVPNYQIPAEELQFTIGEELKGTRFKGWTHHRTKAEY
jgi:hypothetical protein